MNSVGIWMCVIIIMTNVKQTRRGWRTVNFLTYYWSSKVVIKPHWAMNLTKCMTMNMGRDKCCVSGVHLSFDIVFKRILFGSFWKLWLVLRCTLPMCINKGAEVWFSPTFFSSQSCDINVNRQEEKVGNWWHWQILFDIA